MKKNPEQRFYFIPHTGRWDSLPLHLLEHKGTANRPDWLLCLSPDAQLSVRPVCILPTPGRAQACPPKRAYITSSSSGNDT